MDASKDLTIHERVKALEEANANQQAQIDALMSVISDLIVAHAMQTSDTNPVSMLRERYDSDHSLGKSGGTPRTPTAFFENRAGTHAELLRRTFESDMCFRYWVRSASDWLDERRYQKVQRMQKRISALSDL